MAEQVEGEYEIINELGLHARAAAQLVQAANRYPCDVQLECEGQTVNGKSIMGVLMLAAAQGMRVKVTCSGEQARDCLAELAHLIASKFGEGR
jgi:phosphocarrier protein